MCQFDFKDTPFRYQSKLNFIDLFSGAGGLSYGLEKAGLNCLVGIDFLAPAIETFNHNHPNSIGIWKPQRDISQRHQEINW